MISDAVLPGGFVLNVYKEIPWTSHDAVSRVRRILGTRQVGHAGSLDPFACGVLVLAVGRATRLVEYLMELPKCYRGTFLFGRRTVSGDCAGKLLEEGEVPRVDQAGLQEIADSFVGHGVQVPPMVSAVKHEGKRLYELARKGVEVERAPRPVYIERFTIHRVELPRVDFELDCGRGTYVRTLIEDLAGRLQALATVESLTRTRVGPLAVWDSVRLISSPGNARAGLLAGAIPMAQAVGHLPMARLSERWVQRVRHGGSPPWKAVTFEHAPRPGQTLRLLGPEGELIATAKLDLLPGPADRPLEQSCFLRLDRVF